MTRTTGVALPALLLPLLLLAASAARADCHWRWHCDKAAGCGMVPFCDTPHDTPPPLRGARLPEDERPVPLPPGAYAARKPLPGFKPVNPPPPGLAPGPDGPAAGSAETTCARQGTRQVPPPARK